MRISDQELLYDLHASATAFSLITFNGTTYADATPAATHGPGPVHQQYISTRANGVRFRLLAGGPYKLDHEYDQHQLQPDFRFRRGRAPSPYVPHVGDKLALPLLSRELALPASPRRPPWAAPPGPSRSLPPLALPWMPPTAGNVTTGYFYRSVRLPPFTKTSSLPCQLTGAAKSSYRIIRDRITSPSHLGAFFATTSSPSSTGLNLRMSLEWYDTNYSARQYTAAP